MSSSIFLPVYAPPDHRRAYESGKSRCKISRVPLPSARPDDHLDSAIARFGTGAILGRLKGPGVVDLKCRYKSSSCCSCTNVSFCFLVLKSTKMTYGSKQDLHVKSSPPVQPRQPINSDPTIIQNPLSFTANIHSVLPYGMTGSLPNSSSTARFVPRRYLEIFMFHLCEQNGKMQEIVAKTSERPTQAINWSNERVMLSALNDVKTPKRVLTLSLIALVSLGKPY
ncbi:hypothetical protein L2E82_47144 [Cichorium intybus]|uniref:Uncharacterized protein n=1 Tax=Cichorium intybus TaxID=13427 RepID=A0ACB8YUZ8_CICIN|nr:hypothetical protein L2E82_47144 [Cichorium intybus]